MPGGGGIFSWVVGRWFRGVIQLPVPILFRGHKWLFSGCLGFLIFVKLPILGVSNNLGGTAVDASGIRRSPVEVGSFSHLFTHFYKSQVVQEFLPSTVVSNNANVW